jgi:hypothetical protein
MAEMLLRSQAVVSHPTEDFSSLPVWAPLPPPPEQVVPAPISHAGYSLTLPLPHANNKQWKRN